MERSVALLFLLATACNNATPTFPVAVNDRWGEPLADAVVAIEGTTERLTSDADGIVQLPAKVGELRLKAGKEGYIPEELVVNVTDVANPPREVLKLWKRPAETGFYAVQSGGYELLPAVPVKIVGTDNSTLQGLASTGTVKVGPQLSLIFHTPLSQAQIDAFDLELHRLDYVRSAEVMTVQGPATVEVNLNKSVGKVPMELTPLRTKTDYLITAKDLKPGFYALQSNHLLDRQDAEAFNRIPEDLRIAFPFEVKD